MFTNIKLYVIFVIDINHDDLYSLLKLFFKRSPFHCG